MWAKNIGKDWTLNSLKKISKLKMWKCRRRLLAWVEDQMRECSKLLTSIILHDV